MIKRLPIGVTLLVAISTPVAAQPPGLVVSVASSLHEALAEIAGLNRAATGVAVSLNRGARTRCAAGSRRYDGGLCSRRAIKIDRGF